MTTGYIQFHAILCHRCERFPYRPCSCTSLVWSTCSCAITLLSMNPSCDLLELSNVDTPEVLPPSSSPLWGRGRKWCVELYPSSRTPLGGWVSMPCELAGPRGELLSLSRLLGAMLAPRSRCYEKYGRGDISLYCCALIAPLTELAMSEWIAITMSMIGKETSWNKTSL